MLEKLDSINWKSLKHAYGAATDVPDLLRDLSGNDKQAQDDALYELYGNIFHQGTRYEATPYAVPFLFELLNSAEVSAKANIVRLLINLALGFEERYLLTGFNPASFRQAVAQAESQMTDDDKNSCKKFGYGPTIDQACYDAVLSGIQSFETLSTSGDSELRRAALYAITWFPEEAERTQKALYSSLSIERDPAEIATAALGLGVLHLSGAKQANELAELLDLLQSHNSELVRTACAIALAPLNLCDEVLNQLVKAISSKLVLAEAEKQVWFNDGDLIGYASLRLSALSLGDKLNYVVQAICGAMKTSKPNSTLDLTSALLNLVMVRDRKLVSINEKCSLDESQKLALDTIDQYGAWELNGAIFANYSELISRYGLPGTKEQFSTLLSKLKSSPNS